MLGETISGTSHPDSSASSALSTELTIGYVQIHIKAFQ